MRIDIPAGNKMYISCRGCGAQGIPIEIARRKAKVYAKCVQGTLLERWFESHAECSPEPDHFQLAFEKGLNWDVPKDAEPVPNAVRNALVKAIS